MHRVQAECTSNMLDMSVTLDVSKLRGWLKANALCRVARWAHDTGSRCGSGDERAVRRGCSSRMQARARLHGVGGRVRTLNMTFMVVGVGRQEGVRWRMEKSGAGCRGSAAGS